MNALWFVVALGATWRLSSLASRERGPFAVGTRLRSLFGVYHAPDGTPMFSEDGDLLLNPVTPSSHIDALLHEIAHGMTCIWCCSVWMGLLVALALNRVEPVLVADAVSYLLVTLALSAGTIVLEGWRQR